MTVVNDLVERQGIPVFDLIDVALECATKVRIIVWNECNIDKFTENSYDLSLFEWIVLVIS